MCWERGAAPGLGSLEWSVPRRGPGPAAAETRAAEGGRGLDALAQAAGLEGDSAHTGLTYIWLFIDAGDTRCAGNEHSDRGAEPGPCPPPPLGMAALPLGIHSKSLRNARRGLPAGPLGKLSQLSTTLPSLPGPQGN